MTGEFGNWVDEPEEIAYFNETGDCVCDNSDVAGPLGRFYKVYWCEGCERTYIPGNDGGAVVAPHTLLKTDKTGLVQVSTEWNAFNLLTEQDLDVQGYIEPRPRGSDRSEAWLWASDGLYIGYLVYVGDILKCTVIAEGFRGQGHGSEFITQWFERKDEETLKLIAFDRTKPFLENKLDFPIEYA